MASTDGALIVFDLRSGTELHQIALGSYDAQVTSLAVSPAGDVAATTAVGDGSDVLLYAPAGASRVRALAREVRMEAVATAGGRVAYVGSNRLDAGVRVTVLDGASGARLFRGPVSETAERLSFDGTHLAYATGGCTLLATVPTASVSVLPEGPCVRTEATVARLEGARAEVTCLSAPSASCRVRAAGRTPLVPRGRTRVVPPRRAGATVRVIDPRRPVAHRLSRDLRVGRGQSERQRLRVACRCAAARCAPIAWLNVIVVTSLETGPDQVLGRFVVSGWASV